MKISQNGIDLIKSFEGCALKAYKCPAGVWTIGYGQTGPKVVEGLRITQAEAEKLLAGSLGRYEANVNKFNVAYGFNQNEYDALVSFAYNLGSIDGLVKKGKATRQEISDRFKLYNKGGGVVLKGLVRRREAERKLFDTPMLEKYYSVEQVAQEVLQGLWGTGEVRKARLEARGYDYAKIQAKVNEILK